MAFSFVKSLRTSVSCFMKYVSGFFNPHDPAFERYGSAPKIRSSGKVFSDKGRSRLTDRPAKTNFDRKEIDRNQR